MVIINIIKGGLNKYYHYDCLNLYFINSNLFFFGIVLIY
jgi:hypothetical protein